jgi:PAS domain S-box-containing protein
VARESAVRPLRRTTPASDAEVRLALVERMLRSNDAEQCATVALEWLAEHAGVTRSLAAMVDHEGAVLQGLAGRDVPAEEARGFIVDLGHSSHPLVIALSATEPVTFRPGQKSQPNFPWTPLGESTFGAVPLVRPEAQEEGAVGLLLLAFRNKAQYGAEIRWAAEMLGERLLAMKYPRARAAARKYRRETAHLHGIINAVTDPILLTDPSGRILEANERAEMLLSASGEETEGRRRAIGLNNMLFSAALSTVLHETDSSRRELLLVDPIEGRDLLFELIGSQLTDDTGEELVVAVLRNVTDLRRATEEIERNYQMLTTAETQVRAERDRLDLIISSVADPVIVTDPAGAIILMNPPGERLFTLRKGSGDDDQQQRRVRANDAVFSSFVSNLYTGQALEWRDDLGLVDPEGGATVPVEAISGKVLSKQGELTGVVTILHDRSETLEKERLYEQVKRHSDELREKVREATAELAHQNEMLRRQAFELEQASQLKSQFLANMSHELRTPLNAVLGYTNLLLQGIGGELNPQQKKRLARVDSNARHLLNLINDLLDIARIEAGKMPLHVDNFELHELIDEIITEVEPIIERSKLAVSREIDPDLPAIRSDRQKMKQVLINLLSNALKFTPEGSVKVQARFEEGTGMIHVAVQDTGIGIAPEDQQRVFEDFRQADNSYTREYGGTGLGLAICRRLATMLGGEITLESKVGAGSTFTLHVPRKAKGA